MLQDYLSFRKMITPVIIQIIFWIGVALCVLGGLVGIIGGVMAPYGGGAAIMSGLVVLVFGPLFVRIYCELLILLFRIYDELVLQRTGAAPGGFPVTPKAPE